MKETIRELVEIVDDYSKKFSDISAAEFSNKPLPTKWSKKEVVGHLIDSAHNNLRRFITGQYESMPPKIIYEQDFWVNANGYRNSTQSDVILLWKLINHQIARVLENMPVANYGRESNTGKEAPSLHSLEWLAADYVKHMKHHINQVIPNSFDVIYK